MNLPPPNQIGAPAKFDQWRKGQPEAILRVIDSTQRFIGLAMPTGSGKSLVYMSVAALTGWRTIVLTGTKALQTQLHRDFEPIGLKEVKGQNAYRCLAVDDELAQYKGSGWHGCDDGPCHAGVVCAKREAGCLYYDAVRSALGAKLVTSNYKYWMSQAEYGQGLGPVQCLVLDEAHDAADQLSDFLSTVITEGELRQMKVGGPAGETVGDWQTWAQRQASLVARVVEHWRPTDRHDAKLHRQAGRFLGKLDRLKRMTEGDWIVVPSVGAENRWTFHPLNPARFAESSLFLGIKKIVCTSATITPRDLELIGITEDKLDWFETLSDFPARNRPVWYVPTVRVDHRMTAERETQLIDRVDEIIGARLDRKGIIHTISYRRRDLLLTRSRYRDRMITHGSTDTRHAVDLFKVAGPGTVLVSPSVTTGWDFPFEECEYQILLKVPFPDMRDPVMIARKESDPHLAGYLAMRAVVQAVGRGMRSAEDRCETFMLDSHWSWFVAKYKRFAPAWFMQACRGSEAVPPPPERIAR